MMMISVWRNRTYILLLVLSSRIIFALFIFCSCVHRWTTIASAIPIVDDTSDVVTDHNSRVLTREQIESYDSDGYLYVQGGLLPSDLIHELATAVKNVALIASRTKKPSSGGYFSLLQSNNIFLPSLSVISTSSDLEHPIHHGHETNKDINNHNNNIHDTNSKNSPTNHVYRKVVMDSILTQAVAELMHLYPHTRDDNNNNGGGDDDDDDTTNNNNVRCLRDIVLVKDANETTTCGWHVDDIGFWPVSYHNTSGINVWIALDDMPYRGTMAVAPKSHTASWRHEAYTILGQNRTNAHGPTQQQVREAQSNQTTAHYLTCDMHLVNETLSNFIESTAVYFDNIRRGDIIFTSRLLFHRTTPVTPEGIEYYRKQTEITNEPQYINRYSIRYEPGHAQINQGWNVEWCVIHDPENAGRSLNEIASFHPNLAFYPQVWPTVEYDEGMDQVAQYAEMWKAQAKQMVYDTLFPSYTTTTSTTTTISAIDDATTTTATTAVTDTAQCNNEIEIETG